MKSGYPERALKYRGRARRRRIPDLHISRDAVAPHLQMDAAAAAALVHILAKIANALGAPRDGRFLGSRSGSAGAAARRIVECLGFEETFAEQRIFIVGFRRLLALVLFVRESGRAGGA